MGDCKNVKPIISAMVRIRHPHDFKIGDDSIVDDFCYFSAKVKVGKCSHIASGCSIAGGKRRTCTIGDFCSVSSGVKIWCTSANFKEDLVVIFPKEAGKIKDSSITGDVVLEDYTAIGANSVIMPDNVIAQGTVIGALSFVPPRFPFKPWSVYAGIPIRLIGKRNKNNVIAQAKKIKSVLKGEGY